MLIFLLILLPTRQFGITMNWNKKRPFCALIMRQIVINIRCKFSYLSSVDEALDDEQETFSNKTKLKKMNCDAYRERLECTPVK